jgi:hypothetical protein
MKENRESYEQLADRAVSMLAAIANAIAKANPEKLKSMEASIAQLILCVIYHSTPMISPDAIKQHTPGNQIIH